MTQSRNRLNQFAFRITAAMLQVSAAQAAAVDTFASDWSKGLNSAMRLLSAGGSPGKLEAAIEISLDPKAITYWRNPGDAGAPPRFSFSGSQNVADAQVFFPAPTRLDEGGTTAFGYQNDVVFPVHVTPVDPLKPVILKATVDYAVCAAVCVPATGKASLRLMWQPGPFAALVTKAEQRIPVLLPPQQHFQLTPEPGGVSWIISPATMPVNELFVEAPEGWYFETQRLADGSGFRLKLAEKPAAAAFPVDGVRLTFVSASAAFETLVRLDAAPMSP